MGLTRHLDKSKGECVMEFRDKPMQNLIRIKEKEICKNVQELLLDGEQIVGGILMYSENLNLGLMPDNRRRS